MKEKTIGVLFPGQGSQSSGMGKPYQDFISLFRDNFELASELLGLDLWKLITEDDSGKLNQTEYTQPAIFTLNASLYQLWLDRGGEPPGYAVGHSLGEYNALIAAGVLKFDAALRLVVKRGQLMSDVNSIGSMAAIIGLNFEKLSDLCERSSKKLNLVVECANINTSDQIVIAGNIDAINFVCEEAKVLGAKRAVKLDVSVPSHCSLMLPVADELKKTFAVENFNVPDSNVIFIQNVDAQESNDPEKIQENLLSQLHMPVRWHETILRLINLGCYEFIECGPGKVLTNITKRIDKGIKVNSFFVPNI